MGEEYKDVEIPNNFSIRYIPMSDGAELRHLFFYPKNSKGRLFIYPGMNTLVLSWIHVLEGVSQSGFAIDYVESREKHTAKYQDYENITFERMLMDCEESIKYLELDKVPFNALGSSLGSNTLLHLMGQNRICPTNVVLVGANKRIKVPFAIKALLPMVNRWTYRNIAKKLLLKIVIHKYTDEKADPVQKRKYVLALHLADPIRLKKALKKWDNKSVTHELGQIDGNQTKCHLIGATEDRLHAADDARYIAANIQNAQFIDLKTNSAAHEKPIIDLLISLK